MKFSDNLLRYRRITQIAFVMLIFLVPVLDIFRYDTHAGELIVLGQAWSLGLKQGFYADQSVSGATHVAAHFLLKAVLPWVVILSVFPLLDPDVPRTNRLPQARPHSHLLQNEQDTVTLEIQRS